MARRFLAAAQDGDLAPLEALLAHDVGLTAEAAARFRPVELNGSPGALLLDGEDRVMAAWTRHIASGQIQGISSIVTRKSSATSLGGEHEDAA